MNQSTTDIDFRARAILFYTDLCFQKEGYLGHLMGYTYLVFSGGCENEQEVRWDGRYGMLRRYTTASDYRYF